MKIGKCPEVPPQEVLLEDYTLKIGINLYFLSTVSFSQESNPFDQLIGTGEMKTFYDTWEYEIILYFKH